MTRRTTGVQFKYKSMKLKKSHTNLQWTVVKMEICSMIFSMMKTHNIRQIVYCCWLRMGLQSKETCMRPRCMDTRFYTVVHNVSILAERVFLCDDLDNLTDFCLCSCCWFWTKICLCCLFLRSFSIVFFDCGKCGILMEEHKDRGTRKWSHLLCDKCQNN